jgi:hypothetical protein
MATKFSLKKVRERHIRVVDAPGAIFHVKPMPFTEELELDKSFQTFDRQTKQNVTTDPAALLKAKCRRVILGFTGLPGDDGDIPYSTENMDILCETAPGLMYAVLRDAGAADAVEADVAAKN